MTGSYANTAYYEANFGSPPARIANRLEQELARASRYVRSEVPGLDERIAAFAFDRYAPDGVDPDLAADVVCEMVQAAASSPAGPGVVSTQTGTGPFQASQTFANPSGDLYLSKKQRRLLGGGAQTAFTVSMSRPLPIPVDPWDDL